VAPGASYAAITSYHFDIFIPPSFPAICRVPVIVNAKIGATRAAALVDAEFVAAIGAAVVVHAGSLSVALREVVAVVVVMDDFIAEIVHVHVSDSVLGLVPVC
jgi:hypothetical protein